jgi:hypothetical protein
MFVPVSCTNCGKPFQVPETALGKLAPCPWCEAVVTALPVAAPQPQSQSKAPLPLDDEPAAPPAAKMPAAPHLTATTATPVAPPSPRSKFNLPTILVGALLVIVVMVVTMAVRGYGTGRVSDMGWTEFTPPDGSFSIALPGTPTEEDIGPNTEGSVTGGKRYSVRGWYSKTGVWVSYTDLAPALVLKLPSDKDRRIAAGVLHVEREREVARLKATITKEVERRLMAGWGVELHMDTPNGKVIEWLLLMDTGAHPRLYAFGVEGKELTPTTPGCAKLFNSFRVND